MNRVIDFLLVGRSPLGSALRAAVLGALLVTLGRVFATGWWPPLVFGVVASAIILPLAYLISSRDSNAVDPYLAAEDEAPPPARPHDLYGDDKPSGGPGSHL